MEVNQNAVGPSVKCLRTGLVGFLIFDGYGYECQFCGKNDRQSEYYDSHELVNAPDIAKGDI